VLLPGTSSMQLLLGWLLIIFPGILFVGQIISSLNFELAQKLGLQEKPETADALLQRAEQYAAYWDLVTLIWLPLSGILMIINNPLWPYLNTRALVLGQLKSRNYFLQHI